MKKKLSMVSALLLTAAMLLAACAPAATVPEETAPPAFSAALITDVGGINDQSFNQSAWEGMQQLKTDYGYAVKYLESAQESDYGSNLDKFADEAPGLIWGVGFLMADAFMNAVTTNPAQKYAIVDSSYETIPENLACIMFKAQESSFLVGYIAGKMTATDHVGLIGPMRNPIIDQFEYGFRGGVAYAANELGKEIAVDIQYIESFSDDAKAKATAQVMYTGGADILFAMCGGAGLGVIEAAKEMKLYAIGVDRDQNYLAPDNVITSAMKNVGPVIYDVTKMTADGSFPGGAATEFGVKEGAVGIAPTTSQLVSEAIMADEAAIEAKIADGSLVCPLSEDTFTAFVASLR